MAVFFYVQKFLCNQKKAVKSKRFDCIDTFIVDVEKDNEYVVFNKSSEKSTSFTEITLDENFFEVFKTVNDVKTYIEQTFLDDDISVIVQSINNEDDDLNIKCNLISSNTSSEETISLSHYLNDIDAYAVINKKIQYITSLDDISYNNYVYADGKITKYDKDVHNIDDLICENKLNYVTVTLIPNSMQEKFDSFYEALGDYGEAVDKFDDLDKD